MRAFTRRPIEREPLRTSALPRTDSPSLHPCSASGSASSFLLASALSLHEPLRTPEAEDARCVQPTSATRTNDVHPSAVRSRLTRVAFTTRDAPQQSVAVALHCRGNEHFHDARSALVSTCGCPSKRVVLVPSSSRLQVTSAGLFDRAALGGMRPLTPLSRTLLPLHAHVTFVRALDSSHVPLWFRTTCEGRKSEEPAETIIILGPWRPMTADDPRRLPSSGTLRRIRWPLQPRSRDRRTAFDDVATAG